ncbi:hypothetical protein KGD82_16345 [Nocardiopsis eucommiae]|uniref:Uncharacterized protein n=1 Tax=Nocardiopsis eucommiae TaxID=2831970 RepID=A0A975L7W4_9ACTN|nr:hypothetical protein KGD82_16345 [Nocardiopsis eucommiae]
MTQPDTKLNVYTVKMNGYPTKIQLTEADARKRKLIPGEPEEKPTVQTKAKTGKAKQEGDA